MRSSDWSSDVCSSDLVEGLAGGGDGTVDVGSRPLRHAADDLLAVRGDHLDHVRAGGGDPLAADEEFLVDLHGVSPRWVCRALDQTGISPRATLPAHG